MNQKQMKILEKIFSRPTPVNLRFSDVVNLLSALGADIEEREGSRIRFYLRGRIYHTHKPHPGKEMGRAAIEDLREFLVKIGI